MEGSDSLDNFINDPIWGTRIQTQGTGHARLKGASLHHSPDNSQGDTLQCNVYICEPCNEGQTRCLSA